MWRGISWTGPKFAVPTKNHGQYNIFIILANEDLQEQMPVYFYSDSTPFWEKIAPQQLQVMLIYWIIGHVQCQPWFVGSLLSKMLREFTCMYIYLIYI